MRARTELAAGVYGLGTDIVNWYVVEDGGRLTAVDAGLPGFAATLEEDLRQLGHETFSDGDVLDVPGRPKVVHTPGHTTGHSALLFEGKGVLFAGDAIITHELVTGGAGVRLMPHFVNEDNRACLASLDRLEAVDAELVLVGHGAPWRDGPAAAARQARTAATAV